MSKQTLFIVFCALFIVLCLPVFSQELNANQTDDSNTATANGPVYVINSFNFEVTGYTRPYAIIYHAELIKGEEITGTSNLNKYLQEKYQLLYNQRVFASIKIEHTIGEPLPDGKYPVDLVIFVKDTWNIMVIPRPKYDSNTGFDITLKARDYNFLGTMSPLRLDVGYQYDQEGKHYFSTMLDSDIPFTFLGLNWNVDFDHYYNFRPNLDKPHYYRNTTGLSVELPFKRTLFNVGFTESFYVNQENPSRHRNKYGRLHEGLYMATNLFASWKIPVGIFYYDLGEVNYTPRLSATFVHEFPKWPLPDFRKGPYLTFSHNLSFGRINWIGNFQSGVTANIGHSLSYNFFKLQNDEQAWSTNISVNAVGHKKIADFVGISSKISYRHYFFDDYTDNGGENLRGILDNRIKANYILSFNFDLPFRVFKFRPSNWKVKNEKFHKFLSVFDFDFHAGPFVDFALYNYNIPDDIKNQKVFGMENLLLASGLEVIIFPERWRSLFLRVSLGLNLSPGVKPNRYELFIGTELHY